IDFSAHHELAKRAATEAVVLLKNDGGLLPLRVGTRVAVLGEMATSPRFQGGGSSHVNAAQVDIPLDGIAALGSVVALEESDAAVVFVGLSDAEESEGFDRTHLKLPEAALKLVRETVAVQPNTVVVLSHGGVVELEDMELAPAILDCALLGEAGGSAVAELLFGLQNPSGRLAETIPLRLSDVPSYGNFPGENSQVNYGESLLVGYRWYDTRDWSVAYPFGHGLSYTTFAYSDLQLRSTAASASPASVSVSLAVTNTGTRAGREVVQLYVGKPASTVRRAVRELKGFTSVMLAPGESQTVSIEIPQADLAYWDDRVHRWLVEPGEYLVWAGASSRDLRLSGTVSLAGDDLDLPVTRESTVREVLAHPKAGPVFESLDVLPKMESVSLGTDIMEIVKDVPIERLANIFGSNLTEENIQAVLASSQ
ncbi:MAG: glycoside hydrolase family 3 C-terminal domain-containing protein, partial [Propionibacteriaceae bacterium]|nr:glycoside hydrolase family 3 C-terminal domain-containing protein [Propionibacteriaceae bacterium]